MDKYNAAIIANSKGNRLRFPKSTIGLSPKAGSSPVWGKIVYGYYDIKYKLEKPGLITYTVTPNYKRIAAISAVVVTAAVAPAAVPAAGYGILQQMVA